MKIELVNETKVLCKELYDNLIAKRNELKEGGASIPVLNEVTADIKKVVSIYENVNISNAEESRIGIMELDNDLCEKYNIVKDVPNLEEVEEDIPELDEKDAVVAPVVVEKTTEEKLDEDEKVEEDEETKVDESKNNKAAIALGAAGVVLLGGIAVHTGLEAKRSKASNANTEINEEVSKSIEVIPTETPAPTEEPVQEEEKEEELQLVLGEYGTFFDVNDNEQVEARAQYIFDNYFANNENMTDQQKKILTVENIANTIRVMNGVLPIDAEGNSFYDGNTLNDYTNVLIEAVVNVNSNKNSHYEYFPSYLLTVDGSEESDFIKSYSEIYDKLVYSLNERDDEQVQDAIACLGYKFYNEWYLQGMYEGDVNPHLFKTDLKFLTFAATVEPYNSTAKEWHLSEKKPVCIYACKDYETGEKALLSVNDIQTALETGAWNNIGAKLGGIDVDPVEWFAEYYIALNESLSWKYDHREVKTLK